MKTIPRGLAPELRRAARAFAALIVSGPRRAGKTTLLRALFPRARYVLLEDPDVLARVRADPRLFVEETPTPVILDEIQNAPELLGYIRSRIDAAPGAKGRWLLTGSQEAPLMKGVSESMTGRAAIFHLLPLSSAESPKVSMLRGGFPEVLARPATAQIWFRSYLQTYLERDVRAIAAIRDLATFRRFLALLAARSGQLLNRSDIAAPLGVSVPTVSQWLSILETTSQLILVPPFYENFGKRLIKSPKLYFADSGLLCHLLGIESQAALERSPFLGAVFETFVASEIVRARQGNPGMAEHWPWLVAFTFGLLHGFGFAGALREVGLPQTAIPLALAFFNIGVELGQLAFIACVLAVIVLGRKLARRMRIPRPPWAWRVPPYAIGGLAAFWVIQRLAAF